MILQYPRPSISEQCRIVLTYVVNRFGIPLHRLIGTMRTYVVSEVRYLAMWLLRQVVELSVKTIAAIFKRSPSTVSYALGQIQDRTNSRFAGNKEFRRCALSSLAEINERILEAQYG